MDQQRAVILINQRGNPDVPGLPLREFEYLWRNGSLAEPFDFQVRNENRKEALREQVDKYEQRGVDLRAYDILHFVEDIEAIRTLFSYEKLAFVENGHLITVERGTHAAKRAMILGDAVLATQVYEC